MNQKSLNERQVKLKHIILILSLLSLACIVIGGVCHLFQVFFSYFIALSIFSTIVSVASCVFLILYVLCFYNKSSATVFVPLTFGFIAFKGIMGIFYGFYGGWWSLIVNLFMAASFILVTIDAFKGLSKKVFLIIAVVVGSLATIFSIYYVSFDTIISTVGSVLLYVSLLLFGLNNTIPVIINKTPANAVTDNDLSAEDQLRSLKDRYEQGLITEEEYQSQRSDIIKNL